MALLADTPVALSADYLPTARTLRVCIENENRAGVRRLSEEECVSVMRRGVRGTEAHTRAHAAPHPPLRPARTHHAE